MSMVISCLYNSLVHWRVSSLSFASTLKHRTRRTMEEHLEPDMVLQSDAIEEPFLVPQRNFQIRVL